MTHPNGRSLWWSPRRPMLLVVTIGGITALTPLGAGSELDAEPALDSGPALDAGTVTVA